MGGTGCHHSAYCFFLFLAAGSRVQIAGPTAAFATIVAGIVAQHGMDGLVVAIEIGMIRTAFPCARCRNMSVSMKSVVTCSSERRISSWALVPKTIRRY